MSSTTSSTNKRRRVSSVDVETASTPIGEPQTPRRRTSHVNYLLLSGKPIDTETIEKREIIAQRKRAEMEALTQQQERARAELRFLESGANILMFGKPSTITESTTPASGEGLKLRISIPPPPSTKLKLSSTTIKRSVSVPTHLFERTPVIHEPPQPRLKPPKPPGPTPEEIAAKAEEDGKLLAHIKDLRSRGELGLRVPNRQSEPEMGPTHWGYVLDEMAWLAEDYKQERRWKIATAKRAARAVEKYHQDVSMMGERSERAQEAALRKRAAWIAREVKRFWDKIELIVKHKSDRTVEEHVKVAQSRRLESFVGQISKYSEMLAQDMQQSPSPVPDTIPDTVKPDDDEFVPIHEEDDGQTMEEDEAALEQDRAKGVELTEAQEIAMLQEEAEMSVEELRQKIMDDMAAAMSDGDDEPDDDVEEEESDELGTATLLENETKEEGEGERGRIELAAAAAAATQPKGYTLDTVQVKVKVPFLLKHQLREYQIIGLEWLISMHDRKLNGILADEMGLGKTMQTIALLAWLAVERGVWGPHLIVVPTSVMLNWEMELKKWCPAFKILTYYGSQKERRIKRQGWNKENAFHICITSYALAVQDHQSFRRKKWMFMILDEAQNIKNFKSQRWQVLLNFNSRRRLLLTGTPLQNNLMELWSLMHFLMPHVFQSHKEFRDWFANPITGMIEGTEDVQIDIINRLHGVLRPFLLRRLKKNVETQMPGKYEHVRPCNLSARQRHLYEEFMQRADVRATLASGNFLGMVNVLMQLRKVCNHPDLFESRPIVSPFHLQGITLDVPMLATKIESSPFETVSLRFLNFALSELEHIQSNKPLRKPRIVEFADLYDVETPLPVVPLSPFVADMKEEMRMESINRRGVLEGLNRINGQRLEAVPVYGVELRSAVESMMTVKCEKREWWDENHSPALSGMVLSLDDRAKRVDPILDLYAFRVPKAIAPPATLPQARDGVTVSEMTRYVRSILNPANMIPFRSAEVRFQMQFPDKRLLQFDCGKLQELATLLRELKDDPKARDQPPEMRHRVLIFTQMTRMLDVLEEFLNFHGHTYVRLDGATKPEQRQYLMEKFNKDPRIFVFILSTRSGGIGMNLTGADTVVFYDSDWNPAMDAQAQDRCHRIGQTRDVHIYRLITRHTVEENILTKALQKRKLEDVAVDQARFTTDYFKSLDLRELFEGTKGVESLELNKDVSRAEWEEALVCVEDETDVQALKAARKEQQESMIEFAEDETPPAPTPVPEPKADTPVPKADSPAPILDDTEAAFAELAATLKPIERFALRISDETSAAAVKEQLVAVQKEHAEAEGLQMERLEELRHQQSDDEEELLFYERQELETAEQTYRKQVEALKLQQELYERLLEEEQQQLVAVPTLDAAVDVDVELFGALTEPEPKVAVVYMPFEEPVPAKKMKRKAVARRPATADLLDPIGPRTSKRKRTSRKPTTSTVVPPPKIEIVIPPEPVEESSPMDPVWDPDEDQALIEILNVYPDAYNWDLILDLLKAATVMPGRYHCKNSKSVALRANQLHDQIASRSKQLYPPISVIPALKRVVNAMRDASNRRPQLSLPMLSNGGSIHRSHVDLQKGFGAPTDPMHVASTATPVGQRSRHTTLGRSSVGSRHIDLQKELSMVSTLQDKERSAMQVEMMSTVEMPKSRHTKKTKLQPKQQRARKVVKGKPPVTHRWQDEPISEYDVERPVIAPTTARSRKLQANKGRIAPGPSQRIMSSFSASALLGNNKL